MAHRRATCPIFPANPKIKEMKEKTPLNWHLRHFASQCDKSFQGFFLVQFSGLKKSLLVEGPRSIVPDLLLHGSSRRNHRLRQGCVITVMITALFVISMLAQASASFATSDGTTVMSGGTEEPYIIEQVASASNPNLVYQITGAQIAQRLVSGAYKQPISTSSSTPERRLQQMRAVWSRARPSLVLAQLICTGMCKARRASGSSSFCATIGQDLDLGATSNTLSEWQWADLNWGCGSSKLTYSGSYDGGGPSACFTYSNNQLRESVYVIIVDSSSKAVYTVSGAVLVQQKVNGVESSTFLALVSGSQGKLVDLRGQQGLSGRHKSSSYPVAQVVRPHPAGRGQDSRSDDHR